MMQPLSGMADLEQVLRNREERARRQKDALAKARGTVVSFSVNMPGPVKDCAASRLVFTEGVKALTRACSRSGWKMETFFSAGAAVTGPEAILRVEAPAPDVKRETVRLEDAHPLGRLFDMDVLAENGIQLSRKDLGFDRRRCLLCGAPAAECGRSRNHGLQALLTAVEKMTENFKATENDSGRI